MRKSKPRLNENRFLGPGTDAKLWAALEPCPTVPLRNCNWRRNLAGELQCDGCGRIVKCGV